MFREHGGRAAFLSMRPPSGLENFADPRMVIVVLLCFVEEKLYYNIRTVLN
jgi:hypothetical protein